MPPGPLEELRSAIEDAAAELRNGKPGTGVRPSLERPKQAGFGDYSSNAAMLLAPALGAPPREIAERLAGTLSGTLGERLDRVEVAGPGFLNVFLSEGWFAAALEDLLAAGEAFGTGAPAQPEKVLIEFVSANPTGPLTAASGRHAAYGDALARILELAGHAVSREYYFNDSGSQVDRLGESILARAKGEEVPEDGYQGDYVDELAQRIDGAAGLDASVLAQHGVDAIMTGIRATLEAYRVTFDSWFLERSLHEGEPSPVERVIALLGEKGHVYRSEGAVWLRTSAFGDDKDRVLERSSGETTYFANDVAYHEDKLERGYDRMINPLGSDHHGYIARMKAAMAALGVEPDRLEIPILQFVHIVEGGRRALMSKRRGDFVTLEDLIAEIGVDAARFYMLSRSHESTVDLDLELAREQSSENPVYYVQYAHARIASMLVKAGDDRVEAALGAGARPEALHPAERELIKKLLAFPAEVAEAAERRSPHRIAAYALELAQVFTAFYRDCHVVGAEPPSLEDFRITLSVAAQRVIARALGLLGVAAPASM
ncbi:MAG: arginine--tRNA ligase [Solirubrobacteraceae bacterium]